MNPTKSKRVNSEIGDLESVMIHAPGAEIELMTPESIHEALYSDLLNMRQARLEHAQLAGALQKITEVLFVEDLLLETLNIPQAKTQLIQEACSVEPVPSLLEFLENLDQDALCQAMIQGVSYDRLGIESQHHFAMKPLYNLFFTRDASISVNHRILIADMNYPVRAREAAMLRGIFENHPYFSDRSVFSLRSFNPAATVEGGDLHMVSDRVFLLGIHPRTNMAGVQAFIESQAEILPSFDLITVELPTEPESFIHLDMVFTILNVDECMVFGPLLDPHTTFTTTRIHVENGEPSYYPEANILKALKAVGHDYKPILCGNGFGMMPEREQWHSGANFFSYGPGKVLGYARNTYTLEAMSNAGYQIVTALDVIQDRVNPKAAGKMLITIEGAELCRGGGGCRCMTMPLSRKMIN